MARVCWLHICRRSHFFGRAPPSTTVVEESMAQILKRRRSLQFMWCSRMNTAKIEVRSQTRCLSFQLVDISGQVPCRVGQRPVSPSICRVGRRPVFEQPCRVGPRLVLKSAINSLSNKGPCRVRSQTRQLKFGHVSVSQKESICTYSCSSSRMLPSMDFRQKPTFRKQDPQV